MAMQAERAVLPVTMADIQPIIDHAEDARGGEIENVIADLDVILDRQPDLFEEAFEPFMEAKEVKVNDPLTARRKLLAALTLIKNKLQPRAVGRQGGKKRRHTRGRKSRRKTLRNRK
jgi:hypothetical protein